MTEYERGLHDGWELGRQVLELKAETVYKTFGVSKREVFNEFTPVEVLNKLEYIDSKLSVGDEVRFNSGLKALVTYVDDTNANFVLDDGSVVCGSACWSYVEKTGRHFPEIESLLSVMKERSDNA